MKIKKSPFMPILVAIAIASITVVLVEIFKNVVDIDLIQVQLLLLGAIIILFIFSNLILTGAKS